MATAAVKTEAPPAAVEEESVHPPGQRTLAFVRSFNKYNRGDVAGFPLNYAEQLIKKGVAVEFHPNMRAAIQQEAVQRMIRK